MGVQAHGDENDWHERIADQNGKSAIARRTTPNGGEHLPGYFTSKTPGHKKHDSPKEKKSIPSVVVRNNPSRKAQNYARTQRV